MEAKPEVKAAVAKAARADKAQGLFDIAQELKDAKKDDQAYPKFETLTTDFPDTAAGAKAGEVVKAYEKDTAFIKHLNDSAVAGRATSLLKLAQSYAGAGRKDLARAKLQEVISQFPGTSYADEAKKVLAELPG